MEQYDKEAQKVLRQLGANGSYLGFYYVAFGIAKSIRNPELLTYICKGLYAEIAEHFHVDVKNMERNIRTVVNLIWKHGDRDLLNEIFGKELTDKPKSAEFMDALSQYILNISEENEKQKL